MVNSDEMLKKLVKIAQLQQQMIKKLSQQLNPGQTSVEFDGSGAPVKTHDTVGDLKDPNMHKADEKTAILSLLTPSQKNDVADLKVESNTVKVKFKTGLGTDEVFNALLKAVEKAIPYKAMSVREVV